MYSSKKKSSVIVLPEADRLLIQSLAKLDALALGLAVGALGGLAIFAATNFLIFKGGESVGQNLWLLSQYFVGYEISLRGSFIGFVYGFLLGFTLGALVALLRNSAVAIYLNLLKLKSAVSAASDFIDNP